MTIANTNVIAKVAAVVAGLGLVFSSFAYAVPAKAATMEELQAQIAALMAQIAAMSGGSSTSTGAAFTADMTIGASGSEVTRLQNWLISKGYSIPAGATGYFGAQTAAALAAYQTASGITPAAGYFGPITRAKVNATLGGSTGGSTGGNTSGDLEGGAGSVDSYNLVSGLSGEEVGEDEEDVEVAGLEIEADDGSDLEFTAVRLVFNEGTGATSDFEDYADEVSVMLDGEEVARVDADEFNDDNDWTSTVSLDNGAIIRAGDTGELTVAVSGISNLDSADAGDEWNVDFRQVRFQDADGATISEDPSTAVTTFSFELFATAANTELKFTAGEDEDTVNDAHTIDIDATDETNDVDLLSVNVEVEGDSDVTLDALPILVTVATQDNVDEMFSGLSLWMDGEEVGTVSMGSDCLDDADCAAVGTAETYLFDDMDLTLEAGENYEFMVKGDIYGITDTGDVAAGDTVYVTLGEVQTDLASFDAEDESGEDLADADKTGTVTGSASEVRDVGIVVEFVSADAEISHAGDVANTTDSDQGTFTITFDVTAFGGNVYIDGTKPDETGGATESDLFVSNTDTYVDSNITSPTGATLTGTIDADARFKVNEDDTERFTITFVTTAGADGIFYIELDSILYALTDVDGDIQYTFNLDDFKTPSINMQNDAA